MSTCALKWLGGFSAAIVAVSTASLVAQTPKADAQAKNSAVKATSGTKVSTPRTPWGDPDLQGVWDYRTITPLERPDNMAGRAQLTDEEVARLEAQAARQLDAPPDENTPANLVHAPYM